MIRFLFSVLWVIIFSATTSHATLIEYSVSEHNDPQDVTNILSTPLGSYDVFISGSVFFESTPEISIDQKYTFNVSSFALNFVVPELNEILYFAGGADSSFERIYRSYNEQPDGPWAAFDQLRLNGIGNFESLTWTLVTLYVDRVTSLPTQILMCDGFWGSETSSSFSAPVFGYDDWALLGGYVELNAVPVPEPATIILISFGLMVINAKRKFWRVKKTGGAKC